MPSCNIAFGYVFHSHCLKHSSNPKNSWAAKSLRLPLCLPYSATPHSDRFLSNILYNVPHPLAPPFSLVKALMIRVSFVKEQYLVARGIRDWFGFNLSCWSITNPKILRQEWANISRYLTLHILCAFLFLNDEARLYGILMLLSSYQINYGGKVMLVDWYWESNKGMLWSCGVKTRITLFRADKVQWEKMALSAKKVVLLLNLCTNKVNYSTTKE